MRFNAGFGRALTTSVKHTPKIMKLAIASIDFPLLAASFLPPWKEPLTFSFWAIFASQDGPAHFCKGHSARKIRMRQCSCSSFDVQKTTFSMSKTGFLFTRQNAADLRIRFPALILAARCCGFADLAWGGTKVLLAEAGEIGGTAKSKCLGHFVDG